MVKGKRSLGKLRQSLANLGQKLSKLKFWKSEKVKYVPSAPPKPLPRGYKVVERYPLYEPFVHIAIVQNPRTGEFKYIIDELQLDTLEQGVYDRILDILLAEIRSPKEEIVDPREFFDREARKIVSKYRISLGWLPEVSWSKILYHAERDLVGYGESIP
ncbi:hypothetical protein GWN63_04195 [Candidatus Bathyarchaeota archaeon]|nr:hypothetical protein [Candidatus Bathyarchaeota archaeon]NIU81430.1 hypothetical protein [Candidatus Bathyarchaeota archaeon]NIV68071.1 hypothetical protein [Candidatus Bathyarchaeota archaeon]NIW16482.1 hypothetical protein [Candidatus Bathyarchaeota archaeon]NIW34592.1 hypothetical protein [Candidatus Bathyarchaeota archaeon]